MDQIKHAGRQLEWVVLFLLVVSPLIYIALLFWQGPSTLLHLPAEIIPDTDEASLLGKMAMYTIPAMTPAIYWFALYFIYKLARQYSTRDVFSTDSIKWMRWVGLFLLSADFVYMFQIAITGPLLSGLGLTESFLIFELKLGVSIIGLFILLISRIMLIASEIDEQQRLTI